MGKKIIIASVLKPVDDIRHYRKLALSIAKANKYQIIIFGKGRGEKCENSNISFFPTGDFHRKSLRRFLIQFRLIRLVFSIRPHLLLITTPEILPLSVFLKPFLKYKLIYDVQENYSLNIQHQKEYSTFERTILKPLLFFERRLARYVDHFTLAEKCYKSELKFLSNNLTVLENKAVGASDIRRRSWKRGDQLKVVFTGSISDYSGIKHALKIHESIRRIYPETTLKIIGICQSEILRNELKIQAEIDQTIQLVISINHVSHDNIIRAINEADVGIIGYIPNIVNQNRIPTKLFEYAAHQLPYIYHNSPSWEERAGFFGGGIPIHFDKFEPEEILIAIEKPQEWNSEEALWRHEEALTQKIIFDLIGK